MRYVFVTGLVTLVYVAMVLLTTEVLRFQTPLAATGATVAGALLFNLPRRRLQRAVRRRYHRPA